MGRYSLIERRVLRDARCVFYTCKEEMLRAPLSFGRGGFREAIVPLGVRVPPDMAVRQIAAFHEKVPITRGKHIALFLGRLHEKKGCDLLIEAFSTALSIAGAACGQYHLVMAGPANNYAYASRLKCLAREKCYLSESDISWPGMLTGDAKWGAFRAAEVLVLPSHQENFGLAVVEALSCGTPALISDKVNIWREIDEAGAGVVDSDDLLGVERLLCKWIGMPSDRIGEMRRAAFRCFSSNFEINRSARRLVEVMEGFASIG